MEETKNGKPEADVAGKQLEKTTRTAIPRVDVSEEPSAEWGWHGQFPRVTRLMGVLVALSLLAMLHGNHRGRIEDIWLIGLAVGLLAIIFRDALLRRTSWRK